MAQPLVKRIAGEALTIAALVVSGGFIISHIQRDHARSAEPSADTQSVRIALQNRLIGASIALPRFAGLSPDDAEVHARRSERRSVLWFIDLERCGDCLGTAGAWNRLAEQDAYDMTIVFVDGITGPATRIFRNTKFTKIAADKLEPLLGPVLSSTKLLLSPSGHVLFADTRAADTDCAWMFEALVEVLSGSDDGSILRRSPAPQPAAKRVSFTFP